MSPLSPLLRGSFTWFSYSMWWPALPVSVWVSRLRFSFYSFLPFLFSFCFFSLFVFMRVPA